MSPKILYRVAAALLLLFAILHTMGFRVIDPEWGVDALIRQLRDTTFLAQGQTRSYWDFFVGFGFSVTVWQLFAGLVAWQLSGLSAEALASLPLVRWGLVAVMAATVWLSWVYFFPAPLIFSVLITVCLGLAAWRGRPKGS